MIATRRKIYTDKILDNLLDAQKNMASAEKVDAKGLVYLSRFILRLLKQLDNEVIELCAEAEDERNQDGLLEPELKETLVQRLGQYEDTGLTPEEIRELRREDNRFQTFNPD